MTRTRGRWCCSGEANIRRQWLKRGLHSRVNSSRNLVCLFHLTTSSATSMPKDIGVTHYVDGYNSWKLGFMGFLVQLRGHITGLLFGIPLMGSPFWWPEHWPDNFTVNFGIALGSLSAFILTLCILSLFYLRKRSIRSLAVKASLHDISHNLRDQISELFRRTSAGSGKPKKSDGAAEARHIVAFAHSIADKIRDHFRLLTRDATIECAIRIAHQYPSAEGGNKLMYRTIGRSSGLNPKRKASSKPIPFDSGIPSFFRSEHGGQGVLFYSDITKAIASGAFLKTPNEETFPEEIATMMVAPLNGWDGNSCDMIGILYVTSRRKSGFRASQVDSMKFVADALAGAFVALLGRLHSVGTKPDLTDPNL